jgi:hypothetical protein
MQHGLLAVNHQGMAGIVSALETNHHGRAVGQDIDYFALAFVSPLGAQNYYAFTHAMPDSSD